MSENYIKYFGIMRMIDNTIFASQSKNDADQTTFRNEFKHLMKKIDDTDIQEEERQKINSQNGVWFFTSDKKRVFYAVLAPTGYPERHAYALIGEVMEQLHSLNDYYMETEDTVNAHTSRYIPKLMEKYSDISKFDKVTKANEQVTEIKDVMHQNLSKATKNAEDLERVNMKSKNLKDLAKDFHQNSDSLAKVAEGRNNKILVIGAVTGVTALAIILFIVL